MVDEKTREEALNMMSQVGSIAVQFKDTMDNISKTLDTLTNMVEAGSLNNTSLLSIGDVADKINKARAKVIDLSEDLLNTIFLNLAIDETSWNDLYQEKDTQTK